MGISGRLLQWHMTHTAIVEELNGKRVDWMEKVSDEQYQAGSNGEIDAAYRTKYRRHLREHDGESGSAIRDDQTNAALSELLVQQRMQKQRRT